MEVRTLKALKESIAKWDKNTRVRNLDNAKIESDECPLCHLFLDPIDGEDCAGCPVLERTGQPYCSDSPYDSAYDAYYGDCAQFRAAAKAERDFLISLLPEGETWK